MVILNVIMCYWQVDAYEAKNQELVAENTDLRALLRSMQVYVNYCTVDMFKQFNGFALPVLWSAILYVWFVFVLQ